MNKTFDKAVNGRSNSPVMDSVESYSFEPLDQLASYLYHPGWVNR